jgi:hypothetical protein
MEIITKNHAEKKALHIITGGLTLQAKDSGTVNEWKAFDTSPNYTWQKLVA